MSDTMVMPAGMTEPEQFFWSNAGWSYDPATETAADGRARCARDLAYAEQALRESTRWSVTWEADTEPYEPGDAGDPEPETVEGCILADLYAGDALGSLWSIADATPDYRRVVEAELADEAIRAGGQPYFWSPDSAAWQAQNGEKGTPRTDMAIRWLRRNAEAVAEAVITGRLPAKPF